MKIFRIKKWLNNLWIVRAIDEIRDIIILYKTTKKNKEYLNEYNVRLDWIGRPYTVINVPENMAQKKEDTESFIILQLRKYDAIFVKLGITELIYPEITRIQEPGTFAFLFSFKTKIENLRFWRILIYLIKYFLVIFLVRLIIVLVHKNTIFFIDIFNFFKDLF